MIATDMVEELEAERAQAKAPREGLAIWHRSAAVAFPRLTRPERGESEAGAIQPGPVWWEHPDEMEVIR